MKLAIALLGLLASSNALVVNTRPAVAIRRATSSCTPVSVPQRAGEPEMFIFWCAPPRSAHVAIFHAVHAQVTELITHFVDAIEPEKFERPWESVKGESRKVSQLGTVMFRVVRAQNSN